MLRTSLLYLIMIIVIPHNDTMIVINFVVRGA